MKQDSNLTSRAFQSFGHPRLNLGSPMMTAVGLTVGLILISGAKVRGQPAPVTASTNVSHTETNDGPSYSNLSDFALQEVMKRDDDKKEQLGQQIDALNIYQAKLTDSLSKFTNSLKFPDLPETIKNFQTSVKSLLDAVNGKSGQDITSSQLKTYIDKFLGADRQLQDDLFGNLNFLLNDGLQVVYQDNGRPIGTSNLPDLNKLVLTKQSAVLQEMDDGEVKLNLEKLQQLRNAAYDVEDNSKNGGDLSTQKDALKSNLNDEMPNIMGLKVEIVTGLRQTLTDDVKKALNEVNDEVTSEIKSKNAEIEKTNADFQSANKELLQRNLSQKATVTLSLNYIIFGGLGAIILTIGMLRFGGANRQAKLMIQERTAVDLISIGFFLSIVLFLGAGGFIQPETLGTLLGTVAGYLFGRRSNAPATPTEVANSDQNETPPSTPPLSKSPLPGNVAASGGGVARNNPATKDSGAPSNGGGQASG